MTSIRRLLRDEIRDLFQHWAANQHIRKISEGSCDTEYGSNDAENSALPLHEQITF